MTRLDYRKDIDGLRAVAVLLVIGYHASPSTIPAGFIGVDIFFVISGYLITLILLTDIRQEKLSYMNFYSRRIRRLFPALLVVLLICYVIGWHVLFADEFKQLGKHIAGGAGFVANFILWGETGYFDNSAESKLLLHLWSLGIEEQFYLLWPLILAGVWKNRDQSFGIILFLLAASFLSNFFLINDTTAFFYSPLTRFWELFIGVILAHLHSEQRNLLDLLRNRYSETASIAGITLILVSLILIDENISLLFLWMVLPTLGTALIIFAGDQAYINRLLLSNKPMVGIGLISFPLYLWHWPLFSYSHILQGSVTDSKIIIKIIFITFLAASMTYFLIEKPLRFGKYGLQKSLILLICMIVMGFVGYVTYHQDGFGYRNIITLNGKIISADNILDDKGGNKECPDQNNLHPEFLSNCTLHINPRANIRIVLWGDSHAGNWQYVFEDIAEKNNYELYVITHGGCPPLLKVYRPGTNGPCKSIDTTQKIMSDIIRLQPDRLVLTARWGAYYQTHIDNSEWQHEYISISTAKTTPKTTEESKRTIKGRITATILQFREAHIEPIIIESVPALKGDITKWRQEPKELAITVDEHLKISGFSKSIFRGIPGLLTFDPALKLCKASCKTHINGKAIYSDDNHLNEEGSFIFKEEIEALLVIEKNQSDPL